MRKTHALVSLVATLSTLSLASGQTVLEATYQNRDSVQSPRNVGSSAGIVSGYFADPQDGMIIADTAVNQKTSPNLIGNFGINSLARTGNPVLGFKLPDLGGDLENLQKVELTITRTGWSQTPNWSVQLYAFDPTLNPQEVGAANYQDVYWIGVAGAIDERTIGENTFATARHLTSNLMSRTSTPNPNPLDLTDHFKPAGMLADFYHVDGTPKSLDGMIWFRLSPDRAPTNNEVVRIEIQSNFGMEDSPTLKFTVNGTPPPAEVTYETWKAQHFMELELGDELVSGTDASPAGDGIVNLLKYALGLDPKAVLKPEHLPRMEIQEGKVHLVYLERRAASDIVYVPQVCGDLSGWDGDGIAEVHRAPHPELEDFDRVTAETSVTGSQVFLRLSVEKQ